MTDIDYDHYAEYYGVVVDADDELDDDDDTGAADYEFDVVKAADGYTAATATERAILWESFSDDERHSLATGAGITGPVTARLGEDFAVIGPDNARYREAMAGTAASVRAGIALLRRGDLDADPALAERIEDLAASAELYPDDDDRHYGALQRAERLIEQARLAQSEAIPFAESMIATRVESPDADGNVEVVETDYRGKERTTLISAERIDAAERATATEVDPWRSRPSEVTTDEAAEWDYRTWGRFEKEYPDYAEALAMGADALMADVD